MLGSHVVVIQVARLFHGVFDDLLGARCLRQLAHGDHVGTALDELLNLQANLSKVDVEVLQHIGRDTASLLDEPKQHVLGSDVLMIEALRFLIGKLHDLSGTIRETFVHQILLRWRSDEGPAKQHRRGHSLPDLR